MAKPGGSLMGRFWALMATCLITVLADVYCIYHTATTDDDYLVLAGLITIIGVLVMAYIQRLYLALAGLIAVAGAIALLILLRR